METLFYNFISENLLITDLCTRVLQLILLRNMSLVTSFLNLFIKLYLKCSLKYFILKSINSLKEALKNSRERRRGTNTNPSSPCTSFESVYTETLCQYFISENLLITDLCTKNKQVLMLLLPIVTYVISIFNLLCESYLIVFKV